MADTILISQDVSLKAQAEACRASLLKAQDNLEGAFFDLCDLLREAQENNYHVVYGFARFGDWVESQGSGLDLSARSAYYFISIATKAEYLGVTREMMKKAKISKLKEIFRLDPAKHAHQMMELIEDAATAPLEEIKSRVQALLAKDGESPSVYMTLKFDVAVKETFQRALQLAKLNYGDSADPSTGDPVEPTDSQALELLSVNFLNDPNNYPEGYEPETVI
jgi:hypothetical protein